MADNWRALALGARRIPDDPAKDLVAQRLGSALGLDQEALASRMQRLSALQQRDPATGMAPDLAAPGSEQVNLGLDIASNFGDMAGIIRAYHGSPHLFDRFDMSKIGTGEGAQAYGHGGYFAENPEVAKSYVNPGGGLPPPSVKLGDRVAPAKQIADELFYKKFGTSANAVDLLVYDRIQQGFRGAFNDAASNLDVAKFAKDKSNDPYMKGYRRAAKEIASKGITKGESGATYTVDLDVNHEDLLDWDAPLSQQPEKVRKALEGLGVGNHKYLGREAYERLASKGGVYAAGVASADLRAAGIPGIRYLDQDSRAGGEGSRNLVIFDDMLIKLLERNGMPVGKP